MRLNEESCTIRVSDQMIPPFNVHDTVISRGRLRDDLFDFYGVLSDRIRGGAKFPQVGRVGVIIADSTAHKRRPGHKVSGKVGSPGRLAIQVLAIILDLLVPSFAGAGVRMAVPQDMLGVCNCPITFNKDKDWNQQVPPDKVGPEPSHYPPKGIGVSSWPEGSLL